MNFTVHESIKGVLPNCRFGYITINDAAVRGTPLALTREFIDLQAQLAKVYNLDILPSVPRITSVRNMYKKLDFDPSRYRPASEALVRRVLQGKGLYYVNSAVDVNNFCSMKYLLPFGLYDLDKIEGNIVYRIAEQGEYINIAGKGVSTEGKPFLTDNKGVFGNPTSDSRRTAVTLSTTKLLSVVYTDEEVDEEVLRGILDYTSEMLVRYNGGRVIEKNIVYA
jgi:DNA/RNA-binding domain of Phe-tRNA-synthetase-like protein